jgi:drug/metabolite transporter, DME family
MNSSVLNNDYLKGIVALFILAFVFASFGIFSRYLNGNFTILQQLYLRISLATIITYIAFHKDIRITKISQIPKKDIKLIIFRAIIIYLCASPLNIEAFLLTKYSNVTFLQAIPTTAILGLLFLQEKFTFNKLFIILLTFIGVLFISVTSFTNLFSFNKGDIFALVSDFFFSLFYVSRKWHTDYLNNKELTFFILLTAAVFQFICSLIIDHKLPVTGWNLSYVLAIVTVSFLVAISMFLINYGFKYVKPLLANNIIALESVVAAFIGFFIYKEILTLNEIIGSLLILVSVPLMNREETKLRSKS